MSNYITRTNYMRTTRRNDEPTIPTDRTRVVPEIFRERQERFRVARWRVKPVTTREEEGGTSLSETGR